MYNRFITSNTINFDTLFDRINEFQKMGYKNFYHIIIKNSNPEFLSELYKKSNWNAGIILYYDIVDVDSTTNPEDINHLIYINDIKEDLDYKKFKDVLDQYYIQRTKGYSALYPTSNYLIEMDDNFDMSFNYSDEYITNLMGDILTPKNKNIYIGTNKKCNKCLNCLCDLYKRNNNPFLIDSKECELKTSLKNKISLEVKEVTREEYAKMIEIMYEMSRNMNINTDTIIETIVNFNNKEGE